MSESKREASTITRSFATRIERLRQLIAYGTLPKLKWEECAPCPERRTEGASAKIGNQLFVIGGYQTLGQVLSVIDVFDLDSARWVERIAMPTDVPQTHAGIASDETRFIYLAGGQLGANCSPAVADCFILDARERSWSRLPSLPEPRYAPTMQLWHGRLHVVSGAKPDRWTSACDYWSIGVSDGKSFESNWREEVPIPKGGPHRASAVCDDVLCILGGQDGDVKPFRNDALYRCDQATPLERLYGDSFAMRTETDQWRPIAAMPHPRTHCDSIAIEHYAVMVGGNEGRRRLSNLIQVYDLRTDQWTTVARLPHFMKTTAAYHEGWLYLVTGQRNKSRLDLAPGEVMDKVWRARFDPGKTEAQS